MKIFIRAGDPKPRVVAGQFLEPATFERFRSICEGAGAKYSRREKCTLVDVSDVDHLVHVLLHNGFGVQVDPAVQNAAAEHAAQARGLTERALSRMAAAIDDGLKPFHFQKEGIARLASEQAMILGDDMGLGKTIQGLLAHPAGAGLLVVCPQKPKRNWAKQSARWRPDLAHEGDCLHDKATGKLLGGECGAVLNGRGSFRWPQPGEILITNYELLPYSTTEAKEAIKKYDAKGDADRKKLEELALDRQLELLALVPTGTTVIFDEAHRLANKKAQRTRRASDLIKAVLERDGHAWALTGSPMRKRPEQLASLMATFRLFNKAFGSWPRFLRLMNGKPLFWGGYEWKEPMPEAIECIRKVMLRREFAEVFPDMPPKLFEDIEVDIDKAATRACKEAEAAIAASGKTLQEVIAEIRAGGNPSPQFFHARKLLAIAKIPSAIEIAEEYEEQEQPVVFFCAHRDPVEALASRPGWAAIMGGVNEKESGRIVQAFQDGELKGVAIVIKAGGEALDGLQAKAHHMIFIDEELVVTDNLQAQARLYRMGQSRGVVVRRMVAPETLDEDVAMILSDDAKMIANTISAAAVSGHEEKA